MAIELEKIQPWDGQSGTGADARGVIDRNFEKLGQGLNETDEKIVQLAGETIIYNASRGGETMSMSDAILSVPQDWRKRGLILAFRDIDTGSYKNIQLKSGNPTIEAIWNNISNWEELLNKSEALLPNDENIAIFNGTPTSINIITAERKIVFTSPAAAVFMGERFLISPQEVIIPSDVYNGIIAVDRVTGDVTVRNQAVSSEIKNNLIFAAIYISGNIFNLTGVDNYLINGESHYLYFDLLNEKDANYYNCSWDYNLKQLIMYTSRVDARNAVPERYRKRGVVFTYYLSPNFRIEQYKGKANVAWDSSDDTLFTDLSTANYLSESSERKAIVYSKSSEINIDLLDKRIKITGGAILNQIESATVGRILLPEAVLPFHPGTTTTVVLYNKSNNTIITRAAQGAPISNCMVLFTVRFNALLTEAVVDGVDNYSINGVSKENLFPLYSIDRNTSYYKEPVTDGFMSTDPISAESTKSEDLYNLYDELMSEYPNYITKNLLGNTDTGLPVYSYIFNLSQERNTNRRKPKVFLTGGTHGGERLGVLGLFRVLKRICDVNDSDRLNSIKRNIKLIVIPLVNPFAFDVGEVDGVKSVRWNSNAVDINRNFDYKWDEYTDDREQYYKGTAVFSEKESQFVRDLFLSEKEDIITAIDFHNFGTEKANSSTWQPYCWFSAGVNFERQISEILLDRLSFECKSKAEYIPDEVGYVSLSYNEPSMKNWLRSQGVRSITIEMNYCDVYKPDVIEHYNAVNVSIAVEILINYIYDSTLQESKKRIA